MTEPSEFKVRRVMDVDAIREDPDGVLAFTGMVTYLVTMDLIHIITSPSKDIDFNPIALLIQMLMDKQLILVNYGDPHDPSQWVIEPGPEYDPGVTAMPIEISLN
jgi:hypothetical protein